MVAYYARRAREYESVYAKPERQEELAALQARAVLCLTDRAVLELACGTGYWTVVVAAKARTVRAYDLSEEVLAVARAKGLDPNRVDFAVGDAYAPPDATDCDAGLAAFWWSHVPRTRLQAFVQGFHRSLPRGATMVFLDNVHAEGSSTPVSRRDEAGDTWQRRRLGDGTLHEVLKNFPTAAEIRDVLGGLADGLQVEFGRYYWLATYRIA